MKITRYKYPTPVSIAFLSDLHNSSFERVIAETRKLRPDIIAVTGDVISGHKVSADGKPLVSSQENVLPFLRGCTDIAPTFFSFGNHEWMLSDVDVRLIKSTGVKILDNEYIDFLGISIGGLSSALRTKYRTLDIHDRYPESDVRRSLVLNRNSFVPDTQWLDEFSKQPCFKLLLSHHPEYYSTYIADKNIDLVLSGHCHGGQIRLFGRGLFAPGQGILPKITKGVYDKMIVSAGLSNTAQPIPRLFNPTEIVYISK